MKMNKDIFMELQKDLFIKLLKVKIKICWIYGKED